MTRGVWYVPEFWSGSAGPGPVRKHGEHRLGQGHQWEAAISESHHHLTHLAHIRPTVQDVCSLQCVLHQVQFEVADATRRTFPEGSFDVIYSRDTILHIDDKLELFKRFHVRLFSHCIRHIILVCIPWLCTYSFHLAEVLSIPFFLCWVQSWLKPGGQLLISDYCCGEKPWTPVFEAYVKQRGYILYTPSRYGKVTASGAPQLDVDSLFILYSK